MTFLGIVGGGGKVFVIINKENASSGEKTDLVVLSVGLSLGIEDT